MSTQQLFDRKAFFDFWHRVDSGSFLFSRVNRLTPRMTYLLATLTLIVIGAADYLTSVELMLSPFYAIPCLLVDWRIGRAPALIYGLFASYIQWLIGTFGGHPYTSEFYFYWDILLNLAFYGALIWIVAKLRLALEMEQILSRDDFLTRLANRKTLLEALDIEIQRCRRYGHVLTVVAIDCDNFKSLNEQRGYSVGDLLLAAVADTLRRNFRRTDLIARSGDDDFTLLLPETPAGRFEVKLKKLRKQLETLMLVRGWPMTFSIACVVFARPPEAPDQVMQEVGQLMQQVKHDGKNGLAQRVWESEDLSRPVALAAGASE